MFVLCCRFRRSSPQVDGKYNPKERRASKQSIESYKNETETTTTEVAIIGFDEQTTERNDGSTSVRFI